MLPLVSSSHRMHCGKSPRDCHSTALTRVSGSSDGDVASRHVFPSRTGPEEFKKLSFYCPVSYSSETTPHFQFLWQPLADKYHRVSVSSSPHSPVPSPLSSATLLRSPQSTTFVSPHRLHLSPPLNITSPPPPWLFLSPPFLRSRLRETSPTKWHLFATDLWREASISPTRPFWRKLLGNRRVLAMFWSSLTLRLLLVFRKPRLPPTGMIAQLLIRWKPPLPLTGSPTRRKLHLPLMGSLIRCKQPLFRRLGLLSPQPPCQHPRRPPLPSPS